MRIGIAQQLVLLAVLDDLAPVQEDRAVGEGAGVRKVHSNYHIPISNTATGSLALEKVS
jgi:hypothetical protein